MPQYAAFDSTAGGVTPVNGWYDTDAFSYANLPPPANLLLVSPAQWAAGPLGDPNKWAVSNGNTLVRYVRPVPLLVQSQMALTNRLAAGLAITSTSAPWVNATYALDVASTAQVFQIGLYAKQFGIFPGNGTTQIYPDITGQPHLFPLVVFISFLQAVADLVANLNMQQGLMAQGGAPAWPDQVATIQ